VATFEIMKQIHFYIKYMLSSIRRLYY